MSKFRKPEKIDKNSFVDGGSPETDSTRQKETTQNTNAKRIGLSMNQELYKEVESRRKECEDEFGFPISLNQFLISLIKKGLKN